MRLEITIKSVARLEREGGRITDALIPGFVARRLDSGRVQFGLQYGKATARRWLTLGLLGEITVAEARRMAEKYRGQYRDNRDPAGERKIKQARAVHSINYVIEKFLTTYVPTAGKDGGPLHSAKAIAAALANHVQPVMGNRPVYDVKRIDITQLRDKVAKDAGPRAAHVVLAHLRKIFNWWQIEDEAFRSPFVRGLVNNANTQRTHVLKDDEIGDLWRALDEIEHVPGSIAAYIKVLFLTACRRNEVGHMHSDEIEHSTWTIPAARYKTGVPHVVPLIPGIKKYLPVHGNGFVFGCASHRHHQKAGDAPLKGWQKFKDEIDKAIARIRKREHRPPMEHWTFHDLRRTARTLMARIGIRESVAEAVLGHIKPGIRRVYNQYEYLPEKTDALTRLASEVEKIVAKSRRAALATPVRLVAG